MKRLCALILALVMALSLVACGSQGSSNTPVEPSSEDVQENTTNENAPEPPQVASWEIKRYVDDFGDSTEDSYLSSKIIQGTFRNTATSGSSLSVIVYYEPDFIYFTDPNTVHSTKFDTYVSFRLLEYDDHPATYSERDTKLLKFKVGNDTYEIELDGNAPNGDLYFVEDSWKKDSSKEIKSIYMPTNIFVRALEEQDEVKCVIEINNSTYNFTIDSTDFDESLAELKQMYNYKH